MKNVYVIFSLAILVSISFAHEELGSPEEMMNSIMSQQNVSDIKHIDCSRMADADSEALGDALMERMVGNHALHEQMDAMMGGEGSASLRQMHTLMGENWLGCGAGLMGGTMMPMMMRVMGNYYPAYYSGFDAILLLAIVGWVLFGVSIAYLLSTRQKRHRK